MDQGACPWGRKEWDMTKHLTQSNYTQFAKERERETVLGGDKKKFNFRKFCKENNLATIASLAFFVFLQTF